MVEYVYSDILDGEYYEDMETAIDLAEDQEIDIIYVAEKYQAKTEDFVNPGQILENINEFIYENYGDYGTDFLEEENKKCLNEIRTVVASIIEKYYGKPKFFLANNPVETEINKLKDM